MKEISNFSRRKIVLVLLLSFSILLFTRCLKEETPKPFPPVQHCPGVPSVEYEGEEYPTVLIGNQCWLAKNLNIGTMVTDSSDMSDNGIVEKYCYNSDTTNCDKFGGLYQWGEIMQYTSEEGTQGICPEGWHIPTNRDFVELFLYCDNYTQYLESNPDSLWPKLSPSPHFNLSGFSALPAGQTIKDEYFYHGLSEYAGFWSSREMDDSIAIVFGVPYSRGGINGMILNKKEGYSIRCIKNGD
jgi:uncharacterized protein (TIGR02145 family)